MMEASDRLEREFILACKNAGGQYLTRLGYMDCLLKDKPLLIFSLGTSRDIGGEYSPSLKVESGESHIEMYNIEGISSKDVPKRIQFIGSEGIAHIRPDVGLITFRGRVKGALM